ncbi:MAG: Phenylacetate-coenzyme A ligase [Phycisphaerae bacterium]|nr:Phenylacetate-coenzyme A ligase [Phycisphaerae bacterium]
MLDEVLAANSFYRRKLGGLKFDPASDPLDRLPFTTKAELQRDQADRPPFGSNLTYPLDRYCRYHQTSASTGRPLRWLDTAESWRWWTECWGIVFRGAGVAAGDRLVFPFSFGPFIGFWAAFEGAVALGNMALPAGGMSTTARLRYIIDNQATVVCCTPTYALHLAQVAAEEGIDLAGSRVRALIVAGEPGGSVPATRRRIESAWSARVFDHAGMTEMGATGFECLHAPGGIHLIESQFIAEVIDPATGRASAEGAGELVLTNLGRRGSPLIRYRTGDLVRLVRGRCGCGRHFVRAEGGVLGRVDDMLIVRGNNVFPSALEAIIRRFSSVEEFRITVTGANAMADLLIEVESAGPSEGSRLDREIATAIRNELHFRPSVQVLPPGSLPRFEMKARRLVRV